MGWEALAGVIVAVVLAVVGWIWRLATRLAQAEASTKAAEILASAASVKASGLEKELASHKEHVAAEYVSRDAMAEITAAINRLGDRLDNLFIHFLPKPGS
ncbi:hypothetical protein [Bradyrhizobium sp. STM 3561]|uniref:hypothetical protein n=1 Tax=Bradyrhizobium sp. STM 3561 TaxID=578923 RepID=UPI0038908998